MDKVGRNDPCPCGSGKKFKKCCEFKTQKKRPLTGRVTAPSAQKQLEETAKISSSFFKRDPKNPIM